MKIIDILPYIGCVICNLIIILCYKELTIKANAKSRFWILFLLIASCITFLTNLYIYNYIKLLINSIVFIFLNHMVFKEDIKRTTIKTILIYIIMILVELILTIFTYFSVSIASFQEYNELWLFKFLMSVLIMLVSFLIFKIKRINKLFIKIIGIITKTKNKIFYIAIIILYIVCVLLAFRGALVRSESDYIINVILILSFFFFILLVLYQSYKTKVAEKREEILLNFMKKYEALIEKDRIRRHEILNNLLILKTSYNKKDLDFEQLLNKIILGYENNEKTSYSQIYKLPSGLKGILYYKLNDMENVNLNVNLNISKNVIKELDNLDNESFLQISKILGILLDNAKEAAEKTKEKEIIIDFYREKQDIIIYIENSCENKVDISKINIKGYSSKGKNRGYGLHIVNTILNNNNRIKLKQYCDNNKFISIITMK